MHLFSVHSTYNVHLVTTFTVRLFKYIVTMILLQNLNIFFFNNCEIKYDFLVVYNRLADKSPVWHIDGAASIKCILFLYSTNLQMIRVKIWRLYVN